MKKPVFTLLFLFSLLLSSYANQDRKQDSLWKVANQHMKEQQYEKAANLYKELGDKIDTDYKEINSHKVKDLRKTYSIDELQLANNQQQNHLLLLALIILPCLIIVAGICFLYLKRQAKKLMLSKRKLQKAEKAVENSIRNKSLFISNMSHEIRTPLNALSGFSDVLTTPGIDEETRKQCNDIIQLNSRLLLNLVNDVVDISCLDVTNM
ncbi:MAG: sensor histidine kinase, partial [Bacteroides cellulosilyticus]|nr:sensor histidine kinase [Bacteroides cellulosilyticus]